MYTSPNANTTSVGRSLGNPYVPTLDVDGTRRAGLALLICKGRTAVGFFFVSQLILNQLRGDKLIRQYLEGRKFF